MKKSIEQIKFLKADLKRCWGHREPFSGAFLISPFLWLTSWSLIYYRISRSLFLLPSPLRILFAPVRHVIKRTGQLFTGTDISERADIGPRFFIAHNGTLVVGGHTTAGSDFFVRQGVTCGGDGVGAGHPTFGDNVVLGANAVVVGKITIGSNVMVGANSTVTRDVPNNVVVAGVPARVVKENRLDEMGKSGSNTTADGHGSAVLLTHGHNASNEN
ncbi:DapH/DapD/GlmU-related protein [Sulfitobacter faviae]|uniref:DapH/DapD/GlmU-related protein n=1 Tax=Sulfitobacter faviae TaxID=1775881 RepID=A0AAX3LSE7_9RHOB|nr:DapH/DapD/GlmU-related protein [Sulfitobacter faviae]WCE71616.1 DapH/DapD/GlmU-related protein [Sulfitobacter faviae]